MPAFPPTDPGQAAIWLLLIAGAVVLVVLLWRELQHRARRYGGGSVAALVMLLAAGVVLVAMTPNFLPFEIGLVLLFVALAAIFRPDQVVKLTGGPSLAYRVLAEGRELQLLVRERGGWSVAGRNEETAARVERLSAVAGPGTERYIGLLRETLFADPSLPETRARLEDLAAADAELRAQIGARPMFERALEARAQALSGEERSPS